MLSDLLHHARNALNHAYSPYSGHKVGAALLLSDQTIITGCNIENASYGATICAERSAICQAITQYGHPLNISSLVVMTDAPDPWPPCGMCLQVLAEFSHQDMPITLTTVTGKITHHIFAHFLPHQFHPAYLK